MKKKKRLKKIESLKKNRIEHESKVEDYDGKDYSLVEYWEKEIKRIDEAIESEENKL